MKAKCPKCGNIDEIKIRGGEYVWVNSRGGPSWHCQNKNCVHLFEDGIPEEYIIKEKPMTETKMGRCEFCGHVGEVIPSENYGDWVFENYSRYCSHCSHWHPPNKGGVPLVEDKPKPTMGRCRYCGATHLVEQRKRDGIWWFVDKPGGYHGFCSSCKKVNSTGVPLVEEAKKVTYPIRSETVCANCGKVVPIYQTSCDGLWYFDHGSGCVGKSCPECNAGHDYICPTGKPWSGKKTKMLIRDEIGDMAPTFPDFTEKRMTQAACQGKEAGKHLRQQITAKVVQCGWTEFHAKFIKQLCENHGIPEELLMAPIDPGYKESEPPEIYVFESREEAEDCAAARIEPAPPRISLTHRTFYAVRSKVTGALLFEQSNNGDDVYGWYTRDGFEYEEDNQPTYIDDCMFNNIDEARAISEDARDAKGNPEPVEVVEYELTCKGPVK